MSRVDAVSLFLSAFLARTTFSDTYYLPMQPDLQQAMKDRRFPTYLAPIKDITDEVLRDILPIPSDIQHLTEIFTHVSNTKWVQQFRRLRMPRPSKRANLQTIHPDAKVDDICTDEPVAEGDRDDSHGLSRQSPVILRSMRCLTTVLPALWPQIPITSTTVKTTQITFLTVASSSTSWPRRRNMLSPKRVRFSFH